jgi:hypothetical protein
MKNVALIVLLVCSLQVCQAWWCGGHMLVAQIAYQTVDDDTRNFIQNVSQSFSTQGPWPKSPDFTQLACWADDIKSNIAVMEGWHFINLPYNPDNVPVPPALDEENVEFVITKFSQSLHAFKQENAWELSFALANYVHFMGDIHQPLHCTELYNQQFPNGDEGGNLFKVVFQGQSQALHAVWDSVGGLFADDSRPLNATMQQFYVDTATKLIQQYTFPSSKVGIYNTTVIGQESFGLAVADAYQGINPGDTLSNAYIQRVQSVSQSQITLAGLRLAKELTYFFGEAKKHGLDTVLQNLKKH